MFERKINSMFLIVAAFSLINSVVMCNNPLVSAASDGDEEQVELYLQQGEQAGVNRNVINQAFLIAAENGYYEIVKKLLEAGAIPNISNKDGVTALMIAAKHGDISLAQVLIQVKAGIELVNNDGETALLISVSNGNADITNELLQAGANVNHTSLTGSTPIMIAAKKGYDQIVKLLCGAKATLPNSHIMAALPQSAQELINKHCTWAGSFKSKLGGWRSFLESKFAPQQQEDDSFEPIFGDEPMPEDEEFVEELPIGENEINSYLAVLGLEPSERSSEAIKNAYKTLARQHHPDKGGDTATFQRLNNAYHALKKKLNF